MIPFMAIGQMATSKTGRVLMVAIIAHDLRRWEVFDVGNSFGGVWYIRTRSESHSWPSSEKGWTGRIKGNVRPVHHNLRIPATVSDFRPLYAGFVPRPRRLPAPRDGQLRYLRRFALHGAA